MALKTELNWNQSSSTKFSAYMPAENSWAAKSLLVSQEALFPMEFVNILLLNYRFSSQVWLASGVIL